MQLAEQYTCFEDRPWNIWKMYQLLDKRFPNSRFILTIRNSENWWKSVERWISVTKPWMACRYREHLGSKNLLKENMIAAYEQYNREVLSYFQEKNKLLIINLEEGLCWEPICKFFDKEIPDVPFPHANKQSYDQKDTLKSIKIIQQKPWGKSKLKAYIKHVSATLLKNETMCFYCDNRAVTNYPSSDRYEKELEYIRNSLTSIYEKIPSDPNVKTSDHIKIKNGKLSDKLAIVCCYINPDNSPVPKRSYKDFYKSIVSSGFKLLTVELIFPQHGPQLLEDYQNIITVECPDHVWSKEHLLNIGIKKLIQKGYQEIVWLEPTIASNNIEKWMLKISDALKNHMFVQVFSSLKFVGDNNKTIVFESPFNAQTTPSLLNSGQDTISTLNFGWAARADLLNKVGLYDRALFGRGAIMNYIASFGYSDEWIKLISNVTNYHFSCCASCRKRVPAPQYTWHYITWAQKWAGFVKGRVGFVDEQVTLLHNNENTHFEKKAFLTLLEHGYNPEDDIIINADNTLQWSIDKKELKDKIKYLIDSNFS